MRNLLTCLAIALFAGIIGCGEPAAPTAPSTDGSGTSSTATGDMTNVSINVPGMT